MSETSSRTSAGTAGEASVNPPATRQTAHCLQLKGGATSVRFLKRISFASNKTCITKTQISNNDGNNVPISSIRCNFQVSVKARDVVWLCPFIQAVLTKTLQSRRLTNSQHLPLTVPEAGSLRSVCQRGLLRAPVRLQASHPSSRGRGAGSSGASFIRALVPSARAPPSWPTHFSKAPPPDAISWAVGPQHVDLGRHKHSNHLGTS